MRVKARSHCSDNENDNDHDTTQRERVLLVELLHTEYARANSTNRMRSLGIVIVIDDTSKIQPYFAVKF